MTRLFQATVLALVAVAPVAAETRKFVPTSGVQTFAVREPVLRVSPGDIVETETFSKPGDYYDPQTAGPWPGEVGPFYIEGAAPGDTLVVKILKLTPNRDVAISNLRRSGISAVAGDSSTRMLNDPLPERRFWWGVAPRSSPCPGVSRGAPAGEEGGGGIWPGDFGGNMDASDVREGTTVYLPVFHEGAYFYFGDFHALQGDGEIIGSGLESTADVRFQFELQKGRKIRWPRLEDATHIMVAGSVRPLSDALRIAYVELIEWLVADYGFDKIDAYQVASQAGTVRVANMVDPNYT